jgi:hypothetical protein
MNFDSKNMNPKEITRKDNLLNALIRLESLESARMGSTSYDTVHDGMARVLKVEPTRLRMEWENGQKINLEITEDIPMYIRKGDILCLKAGSNNQKWYLKLILMICTPDGNGQAMISIRNPNHQAVMDPIH